MHALRVLAIDLGASNGRGIIGHFDGSTLTLTQAHRFANKIIQVRGSYFWDILHLYNETLNAIQKAVSLSREPIVSIAIDGWAQDFGLLDEGGNLLGNVHAYRDPRTVGLKERFAASMPDGAFYAHTGLKLGDIMSLFQLMSMQEREKAAYDAAAAFLFVPDLIQFFLTGEISCNITLAALSGLLDIHGRVWSESILQRASLKHMFPPLSKTGQKIGKIRVEGLEALQSEVISIAAHDTMSAMAFIPERDERTIIVSSGTWSVVGHTLTAPDIRLSAMNMDLMNEVGFDEDLFLLKNLTGLWIEQELTRQWETDRAALDALRQAAQRSDYQGLFDTQAPEFAMPGRMEQKITGALSKGGHSLPSDRAGFCRCVLHSLAHQYRNEILGFETLGNATFEKICVVGGGSQNALLNQLTANICGKPVLAGPAEATAIGNIVGQLIALGEIEDAGQARELVDRSFERASFLPKGERTWR